MPTKFLGSDFQINVVDVNSSGIAGNQTLPQVTTLSNGRFAVVYQSDYQGNVSDDDPIGALFNSDGSVTSVLSPNTRYLYTAQNSPGLQIQPVIAGLPGGGFGVVFTNAVHADGSNDPNARNITYAQVSANYLAGAPLAVGDFDVGAGHDDLVNPAIATLSSGRQVVAFERVYTPGTDDDIYLNVVSANGFTTQFAANAPLAVSISNDYQAHPTVAAIGNTALVAYEDATGTTQASANIVARLFDGGSNSLGSAFTIADHAGELFNPKIVALDDHRYAIIYQDGSGPSDIFGKIYDSAGGGSLSAEFEIDQPNGFDFAPAIAATADGGFIATWYSFNGSDYDVVARRYNSDGVAMGKQYTVNHLTDGNQVLPSVAVSGVDVFFAWTDFMPRPGDAAPTSVRGQVMTLTTPTDFNDSGVSDILWRNSAGQLALWDISRTGAVNGGAFVTSGGATVAPDASWSVAALSDFSGDGRADLLWRSSSGALASWTMNGNTITASATPTSGGNPVSPDASWNVVGAGDFNGDGKSDILWRGTSGQLALWTMDGATITSSAFLTAGGNAATPDASWSVAGVGDFNADGKTDLLWRNSATGEVSLWQMDGSVITGSGDAMAGGVAAKPDASWSVAGIGDFNADGTADVLWRKSDGSLAMWLMNGSNITSSGFVTSGGNPVNPDASWHVVEVGDFNGDARTDILWRNDNGALAEWLMKGNSIIASVTPSSGGSAIAPDASWNVQAKPTVFG